MEKSEQSMLAFESGPVREVSWYAAEGVKTKAHWFWKKTMYLLIHREDGLAATASMPAADLDKLQDPDLRYALRLADAADAVGWVSDGYGSSHAHEVMVTATNEEQNSRLLSATYSGVVKDGVDTFMKNLYRCAPQPEVSGLTSVMAYSEDNNPDARFWIRQNPDLE